MYQCRDIVFPGRFIWVTRGLRKFARGYIVSGRPVTPPYIFSSFSVRGRIKVWFGVVGVMQLCSKEGEGCRLGLARIIIFNQ